MEKLEAWSEDTETGDVGMTWKLCDLYVTGYGFVCENVDNAQQSLL